LPSIVAMTADRSDVSAPTTARYAGLIRVSEALRTYHDRDTLFRCLARELRSLVPFSFLGLALYDERTRNVEPFVLEATGDAASPPTLTSSEQLTYWVLEHRTPLVIADVAQEERFVQEMAYLRSRGTASACCLPLTTPQRKVGMLIAGSRDPHVYPEHDVAFLSLVANQVALAIDDATNFDALQASMRLERERLQNLNASDALLQALSPALDVRETFRHVADIAQRVVPHDHAALLVFERDGQTAVLHATTADGLAAPVRLADGRIDPSWRLQAWETQVETDLEAGSGATAVDGRGIRSALRVAIRDQDAMVAVLAFGGRQPGTFAEPHALAARRVASYVALALTYERLAEERARAAALRERERRLEERVTQLAAEVDALGGHRRMVGDSAAWKQVLTHATQVAATDTTCLLLGESGTGKEVVARFLHRASARSGGPFVAINCAALPEPLLESELFGFERGAFTGALQAKPGQLELAAGGVLFLDEVGEMSPSVQAKFLRVLQEREFQRLGGTRLLKANVRIVAATNRNLRAAVERGAFREDLYYRLDVFAIRLPPLRERREDIPPLCDALLRQIAVSFSRPPAGIAREALDALLGYDWPGNVRELRNVLERAAILCAGGLIAAEHLAFASPDLHGRPAPAAGVAQGATRLKVIEKATIERALADAQHNKSLAAKRLGLTRKQLYVRLRQHGL
jgi:transcriptional regulator with GAF, ATPase, and Fis domain